LSPQYCRRRLVLDYGMHGTSSPSVYGNSVGGALGRLGRGWTRGRLGTAYSATRESDTRGPDGPFEDNHVTHSVQFALDPSAALSAVSSLAGADRNIPVGSQPGGQMLEFIDRMNGWLSCFVGIWRTSDGGRSWLEVAYPKDRSLSVPPTLVGCRV
jgi:hypothetical protein